MTANGTPDRPMTVYERQSLTLLGMIATGISLQLRGAHLPPSDPEAEAEFVGAVNSWAGTLAGVMANVAQATKPGPG